MSMVLPTPEVLKPVDLKETKNSFSSWYTNYKKKIHSVQSQALSKIDKEIATRKDVMLRWEKSTHSDEKIQLELRNLEKLIRRTKEREAKAKNIIRDIENQESLRKMLLKLKEHASLESISNDSNGNLNFFTKEIRQGARVIGKFKITLTTSLELYVFNLTKIYRSMDHWAVNRFRPCLGQYNDIVFGHVFRGDLYFFIDTMIHFIQTADDRHAYCRSSEWFEYAKKLSSAESAKKAEPQLADILTISTKTMTTQRRMTSRIGDWVVSALTTES